jgi:uncharacterized protein YndB with AHSA1/START domain
VASNRIVVDAPPTVVFRTLVDPSSYAYWVVGAKTIRAVDDAWPAPGSRFHHSVGVGPVLVEDSTSVLSVDPPHLLDLEVRFRPVGVASVQLRLESVGADRATLVSMSETWTGGWVLRLATLALDEVVGLRNAWSLRRLRRLAEQRLDDIEVPGRTGRTGTVRTGIVEREHTG